MGEPGGLESSLRWLELPTSAGLLQVHGAIREELARGGSRGGDSAVLRNALRLNERFHSFLVEIETSRASKRHAETASYMELGSIGGLTLQDFSGEMQEKSVSRILLAGISQGLAFLGTREFVKAGQAGIDGILAKSALAIQEEFWSLAEDTGEKPTAAEAGSMREALLGLSAALAEPRIDASRRTALATALFAMLLRTRIETSLGRPRKRGG
jgi:hypothetical protein